MTCCLSFHLDMILSKPLFVSLKSLARVLAASDPLRLPMVYAACFLPLCPSWSLQQSQKATLVTFPPKSRCSVLDEHGPDACNCSVVSQACDCSLVSWAGGAWRLEESFWICRRSVNQYNFNEVWGTYSCWAVAWMIFLRGWNYGTTEIGSIRAEERWNLLMNTKDWLLNICLSFNENESRGRGSWSTTRTENFGMWYSALLRSSSWGESE